jgi:D-alanyl-D-alanine carboxypeptidase
MQPVYVYRAPVIVPAVGWWSYPKEIKQVTRSGDDLLVLVNKEYRLSSTYVPKGLTLLSKNVINGTETFYLRDIVLGDLERMNRDALADGITLVVVSAYRSYATQQTTYNYWVRYNGGNTAYADMISARPGHSQHQLGTTIDFSSAEVFNQIGLVFSRTKASAWLAVNAWKYGFVLSYPAGYESVTGYSGESWHYRYIGVENARQWKNSGMILETWLRSVNGL